MAGVGRTKRRIALLEQGTLHTVVDSLRESAFILPIDHEQYGASLLRILLLVSKDSPKLI